MILLDVKLPARQCGYHFIHHLIMSFGREWLHNFINPKSQSQLQTFYRWKWLSLPLQEVVSYMSPVEAFATGIKIFDQQKVCLITWSSLLKLLIAWFFMGQGSDCNCTFLILWFLQFRGYLDPLVGSQKGFDRLINFDPDRKCFYTGHISDYSLLYPRAIKSWRWESTINNFIC